MTEVWTVGHPPPRASLTALGESFGWHPTSGNLLLSALENPMPIERRGHHAGSRLELALLDRIPLLVLFVRFGYGPWQEAPWGWIVGDVAPEPLGDGQAGGASVFHDVLVDVRTSLVVSMRAVTVPARFTRSLDRALQAVKAHGPLPSPEFVELAHEHQRRHPDPCSAVPRATARTVIKSSRDRTTT